MKKDASPANNLIGRVSSYISRSGDADLPAEIITAAKHHILDTLAAMVSGSTLKPGQVAKTYARKQAGGNEAQVVASPIVTSMINAAFANGVMAHADETDDSHSKYNIHPGCAVVPAALAMAEAEQVDGMRFLKGVVTGYDFGCRIALALGMFKQSHLPHAPHSVGSTLGAAAAAASVARLKDDLIRYVLSYAVQQASGVPSFFREDEHIEKAFVFAGMPARNGVTSVALVQAGFTGVRDCFTGPENFFETFSPDSKPELAAEGLGSRYEIMSTTIKKFSSGYSIQAALDALSRLIDKHGITADDVQSVVARMPGYGVHALDKGNMPNINLMHLLAVILLDGKLTFAAAHSQERMTDPAVLEVRKRIRWEEDPDLTAAQIKRQAIIEITTRDGAKFREHVVGIRGTPEFPLTTEEVEIKCRDLLSPVLGEDRSHKLIDAIWNLERVKNMRELRPLLSAS